MNFNVLLHSSCVSGHTAHSMYLKMAQRKIPDSAALPWGGLHMRVCDVLSCTAVRVSQRALPNKTPPILPTDH